MDNFISLLDNTLKMNCEVDKSDEELMEVPVTPPRLPRQNGRQPEAQPPRKHSAEVIRSPVVAEQRPALEEAAPVIHHSASMPSQYFFCWRICVGDVWGFFFVCVCGFGVVFFVFG